MEKVDGTSGGSGGGELLPFGIREAAEGIARRKALEARERERLELLAGYEQAVNEYSTNPFWRQTGLDKSDIERALRATWREDERVLAGGELARIIVPFEKEADLFGRFGGGGEHEYKLVQEV